MSDNPLPKNPQKQGGHDIWCSPGSEEAISSAPARMHPVFNQLQHVLSFLAPFMMERERGFYGHDEELSINESVRTSFSVCMWEYMDKWGILWGAGAQGDIATDEINVEWPQGL